MMTAMEFMARLAALVAPPRYPLVRYAGVLGPRSSWRRDIVPKARERRLTCDDARGKDRDAGAREERTGPMLAPSPLRPDRARPRAPPRSAEIGAAIIAAAPAIADPGDTVMLAPNVIAVRHWERLRGGALYATAPRVDWAKLLRRSLGIDVLQCPKCDGRLRLLAVITEQEPVRRILAQLGLPSERPPLARARDPTDDVDDAKSSSQLELGIA
jgi:hypothetical protein